MQHIRHKEVDGELAAARIVGLDNRLSILNFVTVRQNNTIKPQTNFLSIKMDGSNEIVVEEEASTCELDE